MTDLPGLLDQATALINDPSAYPDPIAEMARLRRAAPAKERWMFDMLEEGLALALQGGIGAPDAR